MPASVLQIVTLAGEPDLATNYDETQEPLQREAGLSLRGQEWRRLSSRCS